MVYAPKGTAAGDKPTVTPEGPQGRASPQAVDAALTARGLAAMARVEATFERGVPQ